jgi:hypothetical protein
MFLLIIKHGFLYFCCKDQSVRREGEKLAVDPRPQNKKKETAEEEGISLNKPEFLVYLATASGGYALRHLMIPCLMESLRELNPSDCLIDACQSANHRIENELKRGNFGPEIGQLPKIESTLTKKFCITKFSCNEIQSYPNKKAIIRIK